MLIRHICGLAAAFSCALFALAEEVRLTAEVPLAPHVVSAPAPGDQRSVQVASAGRDFLAIWRDGTNWMATRIDADGRFAEPHGHKLAGIQSHTVLLASDGFSYLVTWETASGCHSLVLNEDGHPVSGVEDLPIRNILSLHSNGSTYFVLRFPGMASLLDRNGRLIRSLAVTENGWLPATVSIAPDGAYHVIGAGVSHVRVERITDDAVEAQQLFSRGLHTTTVGEHQPMSFATATSPDGILLTWRNAPTPDINIALLGYDGTMLNRSSVRAERGGFVSAVWDGRQFFVTSHGENHHLYGARVQPDGTPVDGVALVLSTTADSVPSYASNGTTHLLAWEDKRFSAQADIVARTVDGFDALPYDPRTFRLLSAAPEVQRNVRIARAGRHELVAWTNEHGRPSAMLDGRRLGLPSSIGTDLEVTPGAINFLVTWVNNESPIRVLGVRIDFAGRILDREPIVLTEGTASIVDHAVAYGRTNFFIAAATERKTIATVRLTEQWGAFDRADIGTQDEVIRIMALWTGDEFVMVYSDFASIRSVKAGDSTSTRLYDDSQRRSGIIFAAAPAQDRLMLFVYVIATESAIFQVSPDGTRVLSRTSVPIPRNLVLSGPQLVRTDSGYVLGWLQGATFNAQRIRSLRLDANGAAIDAEPFDVATGEVSGPPSLAPTFEGVKFAYARNVVGSAWTRIFARTLLRSE